MIIICYYYILIILYVVTKHELHKTEITSFLKTHTYSVSDFIFNSSWKRDIYFKYCCFITKFLFQFPALNINIQKNTYILKSIRFSILMRFCLFHNIWEILNTFVLTTLKLFLNDFFNLTNLLKVQYSQRSLS